VLIDDEGAYQRARKFFEAHMPDKAQIVKLYTGDKPNIHQAQPRRADRAHLQEGRAAQVGRLDLHRSERRP